MWKQAINAYWQSVRRLWLVFRSYPFLSPDLRLRRQINHYLTTRPAMTLDEWHDRFWQSRQVSKDTAMFVYTRLKAYSGLAIDRVVPSDRLEGDLKLTLVCWFDWQTHLCEDFCSWFGIDISACLGYQPFSTVEELMLFLQSQRYSSLRSGS